MITLQRFLSGALKSHSLKSHQSVTALIIAVFFVPMPLIGDILTFDTAEDFSLSFNQTDGTNGDLVEADSIGVNGTRAVTYAGGDWKTVYVRTSSAGAASNSFSASLRFDYDSNLTGTGGVPLLFGFTSNPSFSGTDSGNSKDHFIGVELQQRLTGSNESNVTVLSGIGGSTVESAGSAYENLLPTFYEIELMVDFVDGNIDISAALHEFSADGATLVASEVVTVAISSLDNDQLFYASDLYLYVGGIDMAERGILALDNFSFNDLVTTNAVSIESPTNLLTVSAGDNEASITWLDNATNETGYRIDRRIAGEDWAVLTVTDANVEVFTDYSVLPNTSYEYRIVAFNGGSFSEISSSSTLITSGEVGRFANLSTRAFVGTENGILIGSFQIQQDDLRLYIVVRGPSLANKGINDPLMNPTMRLVKIGDPDFVQITNDDWKSDQQVLIEDTFSKYPSFIPSSESESALLYTLEKGTYSAIVSGVGDTTGFANLEIYELKDPAATKHGVLGNLSNRGLVGTGNDILIGSFNITGSTPRDVYIKIVGPELPSSMDNRLLDPVLRIVKIGDPDFSEIIVDSWKDGGGESVIEAKFGAYPSFIPSNDAEPARLITGLTSGSYSAIITGANGTSGFANLEIYDATP